MPYRIYLPDDAKTGRRYPTLYLLHGLFGSFDNWCELGGFENSIDGREMIVVMPEGENGWYSDGIDKAVAYERYIIRDLIEHCDAAYPTEKTGKRRVAAGNSMGGYGAVKFALKYPELFDAAYSTSGAFGVTGWSDAEPPTLWGEYRPSVMEIFGEPDSDARRTNDILTLAANADPAKLPMLYLDCGDADDFCEMNAHISAEFEKLGIAHEFAVHSGGHDWEYWSRRLVEILNIADERFRR